MSRITTSSGLPVFFDMVDWPLVEAYTWRVVQTGAKHYAVTDMNDKVVYMHRMILGMEPGDGQLGDHENGCTVDNRRQNLRKVTDQQNIWNVNNFRKANATGYEGVSVNGKKFTARMYINGKRTSLGNFTTALEAAETYAAKYTQIQMEIMRNV